MPAGTTMQGDWDAYYTHQRIPILLMTTFEYVPQRFADDELNIPESGNGLPDIVDEASWLIKMNYRLRKELLLKGYSNGGVGGARICSDVYSDVDPNAETSGKPSWQETRRMLVTPADAFMTYLYAGQAAQFAVILRKTGKNPEKWPVELLDAIAFNDMSYDTVNWVQEAEEAFAWASAEENQPASNKNFAGKLFSYRAYAAANLFRLTGKTKYKSVVEADLVAIKAISIPSAGDDDYWGLYSYALADNFNADTTLISEIKSTILGLADYRGLNQVEKRALRWGNIWDFPMLVGQATTPVMFNNILAYAVTKDVDYYNTVHTTADYFLGTNPLHTTWITGVGTRGLDFCFHLDSRHINQNWRSYPGLIPYGPWSLANKSEPGEPSYGYDPVSFTIDGVVKQGGKGTWNFAWFNFTTHPDIETWPGHERLTNNIHSPLAMEFTVHQNTVHGAISYGFVNGREHANATAANK
ncbi:MAG: hypothetical protein HC896_16665, partial [Bacteroidales bacterium]|nr:hypothetical protein [Bacteroidales bacterium]